MTKTKKAGRTMRAAGTAVLFVLPFLFILLSLFFGRYPLPVKDVLSALFAPDSVSAAARVAVWQLRLPRALAAAFVGASLAVSGAAFQSVFRNPLVSSGILGVSNGAGFGACVAIVCFGGGVFTYLLSFTFAIAAVLLSWFAGRIARENQQPVRLTGDTDDVDFYVFTQDDKQRIVLLNTDWTSDRNRKYVCVNTSGLRMETQVTEGCAKHILVKKNAALSFEVPSAIIDDFTVGGDRLSFTVRGAGPVSVEIFTEPSVRVIPGDTDERINNKIRIDMGNIWSEREIVVFLQRTE